MRGIAIAVWLVTGAGCDLVFGPGSGSAVEPNADGPQADATVGECPAGTTPLNATSPANADAHISANAATSALGLEALANVGSDARSRGVFRFPVRTDLGPPIELHLVLEFAEHQDLCGASCGSCFGPERGGQVDAYAATSDWDEGEVTWNLRRLGEPWGDPGADEVDADHSSHAVTLTHVAGEDTVFDWKGASLDDAWNWVDDGDLSVLVIPEGLEGSGTVIYSTSTEGIQNACVPDDAAAHLLAVFCM